jgi:hypothetical protein
MPEKHAAEQYEAQAGVVPLGESDLVLITGVK